MSQANETILKTNSLFSTWNNMFKRDNYIYMHMGDTHTDRVRMNERHALMLINKNVFAKRTKVENYCIELCVLNSLDT